jgi:hypothetical protein
VGQVSVFIAGKVGCTPWPVWMDFEEET